jgi:hypothetical protein
MEKNKYLDLLEQHLEYKYQEYIYMYKNSNEIKFKYTCLGRANSYMEIMGFLIGASTMEELYEVCIQNEKR